MNNAGYIAGGAGGYSRFSYGGAGGAGLSLAAGGPVTNSGRIDGGAGGGIRFGHAGGGGAGVSLAVYGSVNNAGYIAGGAGGASYGALGRGGAGGVGLSLAAGGAVANSGTINGGAGGYGQYAYAPGGAAVSLAASGVVTNHGTITGGTGGFSNNGYGYSGGNAGGTAVLLSAGGAVNNYGAITGGAGGAVLYNNASTGGAGAAGVWLSAVGVVSNYGAITGGAGGAFNSSFYSGAGGAGGAGVGLSAGGVVDNHGVITGGAGGPGNPGSPGAEGVGVYAGGGGVTTVTNFGTIAGAVSVQFNNAGDRLIAEAGSTFIGPVQGGGGTLELAGGSGTITGLGGAGAASGSVAMAFSNFGAYVIDAGAAWTLSGNNSATDDLTIDGTLTLADRAALTIHGNVVNGGQIVVAASTHTTSLVVGKTGATLSGGGTVTLGGNAFDRIIGAAKGATLTNIDNTIAGSGQIGLGKMALVNEAAGVIEQAGASLTIDTGVRRIINDGLIEATGVGGVTITGAVLNGGVFETKGGALTVDGPVVGHGSAMIGGGVMTFVTAFSQNVDFTGSTGELVLGDAQGFHGKVAGFAKTGATSLDLRDIGFVSASEATFSGNARGGTLTVTDGTHTATIAFTGDYVGSTWTAYSDGGGGVVVIDRPAGPASPTAFAAAMAGLGGGAAGSAGSAGSSGAGTPQTPRLATPGAH